jgi:ABC-type sugar transport system ATPase subunit
MVAPSPVAAQRLGVSTVFQETLYAAEQSVVANIFMGMDHVFRRTHGPREEAARAREVMSLLGAPDIDVRSPLWSLSLAERQLVTIARSVVRPWRLLILDEGTSALDSHQRDKLFEYLWQARAEGRSVLFTSHRMDEVESLADAITVLRGGSTVLRETREGFTPHRILTAMAGREAAGAGGRRAGGSVPRDARPAITAADVALTGAGASRTITVHEGEIFGLAGLEGQGQAEFASCLAGLRQPASGSVVVHLPDGGSSVLRSFAAARRLGIAFVPQDRKREGLFFTRSTMDNFGVGLLAGLSRFGFVAQRRLKELFGEYAETVRLQAHDPSLTIGALSGGNQQKVLLARWLATKPRVIVLSDPMRGVDANTKEELYAVLRRLADEGVAIVLLSTEILELLGLCDRIAVFHQGGVDCVLDAATSTDTDIVAAMFGHRLEAGSAR